MSGGPEILNLMGPPWFGGLDLGASGEKACPRALKSKQNYLKRARQNAAALSSCPKLHVGSGTPWRRGPGGRDLAPGRTPAMPRGSSAACGDYNLFTAQLRLQSGHFLVGA